MSYIYISYYTFTYISYRYVYIYRCVHLHISIHCRNGILLPYILSLLKKSEALWLENWVKWARLPATSLRNSKPTLPTSRLLGARLPPSKNIPPGIPKDVGTPSHNASLLYFPYNQAFLSGGYGIWEWWIWYVFFLKEASLLFDTSPNNSQFGEGISLEALVFFRISVIWFFFCSGFNGQSLAKLLFSVTNLFFLRSLGVNKNHGLTLFP